jgi:hypothetical protein
LSSARGGAQISGIACKVVKALQQLLGGFAVCDGAVELFSFDALSRA